MRESVKRVRLSKVALDAVGAEVVHDLADAEEIATDGAEAWVGPDLRLSMQQGGGVDAGVTAHERDVPVAVVFRGAGECPCKLRLIPGQLHRQG
jgi:hypothetical protein